MKFVSCVPIALAVVVLIVWLRATADRATHSAAMVAAPSTIVVNGAGARVGEPRRVSFTLTNRGDRPLTVIEVSTRCDCVQLADLKGRVLAAGESCELPVEVAIREAGVSKEKLYVRHDRSQAPLELVVEMIGQRALPYILSDTRRQVGFFDLDATSASGKLRIITCEADGMPWLGAMFCDLPEVVASRVSLTEERSGPAVVRTYEYRVGWNALPAGREFHGRLHVKTTYHDAPAGLPESVEVGQVAGARAAAEHFTPRVARLEAANNWSDVVVFRPRPGDRWQLQPGWSAPPWLAWTWDEESGRPCLRLGIRGDAPTHLPPRVIIPLACGPVSVALPVEVNRR